MKALSVSQLNNQIKAILESTFERVSVEGEVSNITYHTSGHLYFSIKDDLSAVKCVMFRGNASRLKFRIESGMKIICEAGISVYAPRGEYQLNCISVTPAGEGALAVAYEQLKKKLAAKGYFEEGRKKPLPRLPKRIALITSGTGAALQDMLKVASKRWNLLHLTLFNTLVQGEQAASSIARNIERADALGFDAIVVGRGGGSMEDLWAFNEEIVADAIFCARTPVVSAVGHEVDFVISDFVADLRAPTPSAAMELLLPDQAEVLHYMDTVMERLGTAMRTGLARKTDTLTHLKRLLQSRSMSAKITMQLREAASLRQNLMQFREFYLRRQNAQLAPLYDALNSRKQLFVSSKAHNLNVLRQRLESADPKARLLPNTAQILQNGKSVPLGSLEAGAQFALTDGTVIVAAQAMKKDVVE
jgi:exodeoxyribonuclease VII large subunit